MVYDTPISNIAETLEEELDGLDFFLRVQPVKLTTVETTGWFMYLYPDIHLQSFESLMKSSIQHLLEEEPIFALVHRTIFDGVALNNSSTTMKISRTFKKKADKKLVAIHLEVCEEQAYKVTSIVRRIIASS